MSLDFTKSKTPRVLITGSMGGVGQALLQHMLAAGTHEVILFKPEEENRMVGALGTHAWLDEAIDLELVAAERAKMATSSYVELYGQGHHDEIVYIKNSQTQNKTKEGFNSFLQSKQRGRR